MNDASSLSTKCVAVLSSLFILLLCATTSPAQVIEVDINKIKQLSEQYSPQWQQFENRLTYSARGEQAAAARLNPSIAYDLEYLDSGFDTEYEHYLYLHKEVRLPGHYRNLRERRDSRISQAEFEMESSRAEWMAATRLGFIRILLNKHEIERLDLLKSNVDQLAEASLRRADEGETAGLDDQLLQMGRYTLQARIDEKQLETDRLITLWKNRMGFDAETEVQFNGDFADKRIDLPGSADLITLLDDSPQARADRQAVQSAYLETAFAQSSRLPSVELTAGYKQLNSSWHGFLVGIALPLPLLNSNRDAILQARALETLEQTELTLAQLERNQNTLQLMAALREYEEKLDQTPEYLNNPDQFMDRLLISYREGAISINDFLNSLGLLADVYQTKYSRLSGYYSMILELEAMTGREFVTP
jgi:outer membrane protein TolC